MESRAFLRNLFDTAVGAALPRPEWFAGLEPPKGRMVVVGAGKAAASMARAFEAAWPHPVEGVVVTRYGHAVPTERIEVVEAAHPVPDAAGLAAAERVLASVRGLTADDLLVALMSGGGSSLLTLPAFGVTLEEKAALTRDLLRCGAGIAEINAVRKGLSRIKGGRLLAAARPARVVTFVVSDVPGDEPAVVASGPTVPDATPPGEALRVVERYGLVVPSAVRRALKALALHPPAPSTWKATPAVGTSGLASPPSADPSPGTSHPRKEGETMIVASARISLEAAAARARSLGIEARILSDRIEGEAREVARDHAALAVAARGPCVLLSGGETTVTVRGRGRGRGGRNVEFLAALAQALDGRAGVYALAADTDGIDGTEPTAGAFIDPTTVTRAGDRLGRALAENDAHTLFEFLGDRLITGPTLTNVNDFRAIFLREQ